MTRVLVVDDQQLLRRGLRLLLETLDDIDVVAEAGDGREALAAITKHNPDVVLTDARMPVMDGVELVAHCAREHPGLPLIVLTTFDEDDLVTAAMAAGASGFLLKDTSTQALADAIASVAAGGIVVDPKVARVLLGGGPDDKATNNAASALDPLTPTERAVATLIAKGSTNSQIAAQLGIAEGTVKNHVSAVMRKTGIHDRTALALHIYQALC